MRHEDRAVDMVLRRLFLSLPECEKPTLDPCDPEVGTYLAADGSLQLYR